jgi:hypothetical protein
MLCYYHHHMALQPHSVPDLPLWGFVTIVFLRSWIISPAPNLEDQASVFMTLGDRVAKLYTQSLGTHFSRLLRHAWITVGLFFNPGHHTGHYATIVQKNMRCKFINYILLIYHIFLILTSKTTNHGAEKSLTLSNLKMAQKGRSM